MGATRPAVSSLPFDAFSARLRSRSSASFASESSSAMTSAASSNSRASPTWPTLPTNSATFASTYCARRLMRVSCPSSQVIAYERPFTGTLTWPISVPPRDCRKSVDFLEFAEAAQILWPRFAREGPRPQCPCDLADIEITAGIDAHPVRADEPGRRQARMRVAEPAQQFALVVDDADPGPQVRALQIDRHRRPQLADIADRMPGIIHVKAARAVQIVPLSLVFAVAVEHLHAVVLAVGDIDPTLGVGADIVHDIELALTGAGRAPRHQQF